MLPILADGDTNFPLQSLNLGSITGVVAATMVVVEILKRMLKAVTVFQKVPVFVYAIVVSIGLGTIASKVLKTDTGDPFLAGVYWKVIWACAIAAAGASGFYTWLRNPESVQTASKGLGVCALIFLPALAMGVGGCQSSRADHVVYREGADKLLRTFQQEDLDWASKLVVDANGNDQRDQLPKLTPNDLVRRQKTKQEYDDLIAEDRKRDTAQNFFQSLFGQPATQP